jgi:hypothetical protein
MGSLTSKPKAPPLNVAPAQVPSRQAVVTASPSSVSTPITESNTGGSQAVQPTNQDRPVLNAAADNAQGETLLTRNRGRLSTVLTGFRGLLSTSNGTSQAAARKTLLGE